jgi:hypothetical protein
MASAESAEPRARFRTIMWSFQPAELMESLRRAFSASRLFWQILGLRPRGYIESRLRRCILTRSELSGPLAASQDPTFPGLTAIALDSALEAG